jgi:hypothetical protein
MQKAKQNQLQQYNVNFHSKKFINNINKMIILMQIIEMMMLEILQQQHMQLHPFQE